MITDIEDLRKLAQHRLPAVIYAYVANGGYEQETLARNRADLQSFALLPRVLNDVSERSLSTELAGSPAAIPVALAPVGALGLTYVNGEIAAARAAKAHGVPYCLSTLSIDTLEDVSQVIQGPFWFQLYMMKDKGVTEALVQRARNAGCSTLLLSMDLHVRSQRHAEQKHGLVAPPRIDAANIWDALVHPRWLFTMVASRRRTFGNLVGLVPDAKDVAKITKWLEEQFDPTLSTKDIEWARRVWPGSMTGEPDSDYDVVIETRLRCTVRVSSRSGDRGAAVEAALVRLFAGHAAGWVCVDEAMDRVDDRDALVGHDFTIGEVVERDEDGNEIACWADETGEKRRPVDELDEL